MSNVIDLDEVRRAKAKREAERDPVRSYQEAMTAFSNTLFPLHRNYWQPSALKREKEILTTYKHKMDWKHEDKE